MQTALAWMLRLAVVALILLGSTAIGMAEEPEPGPYVGVWIDREAVLTDRSIQAALHQMALRDRQPQQIVVLIHGFNTSRDRSTQQYTRVSELIRRGFEAQKQRVVIVGLQWESEVTDKLWLHKVVDSTLGLGPRDNPYTEKVALARNIGRSSARRLFLRVQEKFTRAQINIFAHSLGCDLTRFVINPLIPDTLTKVKIDPVEPEKGLQAGLICFAGADIDYDVAYRNRDTAQGKGQHKMLWLTSAAGGSVVRSGDGILDVRAITRGEEAMGNHFPRFTPAQVDYLCGHRKLVIDTNNVPPDHALLRYYDTDRVNRLTHACAALFDPTVKFDLFTTLDRIIAAPQDMKVLSAFLRDVDASVQYYTLWRMETMLCAGPLHLADGSMASFLEVVAHTRGNFDRERTRQQCRVIREGYWPSPALVQTILDALPGGAGRPPIDDERFP